MIASAVAFFVAGILVTVVTIFFVQRSRSHQADQHLQYPLTEEAQKLVDSEARYGLLVDGVTDYANLLLDQNGYIKTWNLGAERLKGYSADEVIGQHFSIFYPPNALAAGIPEAELVHARENGRAEDEGWRVRRDGSQFWAHVMITTLYDGKGKIRGFSKITRDLTARKQTEDALAKLQRLYQQILCSVDVGLHGIDLDGKLIFQNPAATTMLGWDADELIGQQSHSMTHYRRASGAPYPQDECLVHATIRDGIIRHAEDEVFWRKDGTSFPVAYTSTPMSNDAGEVVGAVVAFRDISQVEAVENQLHDNAERMHAILDTVVDGIITINERGIVEDPQPRRRAHFWLCRSRSNRTQHQDAHAGALPQSARRLAPALSHNWRGAHHWHWARGCRTAQGRQYVPAGTVGK